MERSTEELTRATPRKPLRLHRRLLVGVIGGTAVALVLQIAFIGVQLTRIARGMPEGGDALGHEIPGLVWKSLAFSLLLLVPAACALVLQASLSWASAIDRLSAHLARLEEGEPDGPCDLGESEELRELGARVDRAIGRARGAADAAKAGSRPHRIAG